MTITRRDTLKILGAGLLPLQALHAAEGAEPLKAIAQRKGLRFGNAMGSGKHKFDDPAYRALMARECNIIVAENETKWPQIEPANGQMNFKPADEMFAWAKSNGMAIRGHTLIWQEPKWLPKWVNEYKFGAQGGKAAEALLKKHINSVCGHFGKDIISYDVVNEAIDRKTGEYHANVLSERLGGTASEIELAFRLAHEAAPHAQLVYNDFMHWNAENAKHREGVLRLLHELKKRGAPIHALGIQSHIGGWEDSANKPAVVREWRKFLDEVTGMGLDLLITEFDVNDKQFPADLAQRDAGVAALTKEYLDVTLSYPQVKDFLLWGMADHVSWLQDLKGASRKDGLQMRCSPFDEKLQAKPMRQAIADSLRAMPQRA